MKRGKREKRKSPVLQSYILSMLSLVLCCTMFMSATMAWFTSEVTTTGNQIYMGSLDVDLRDANGETLHGKSGVLFDEVLVRTADPLGAAVTAKVSHWQDNAMAVEPLQVVNEGDLAFRYDLYLTLADDGSGIANPAELSAVTDQFEVWVLKNSLLPSGEYVDVEAAGSGWEMVRVTVTDAAGNSVIKDDTTLTDLLNGSAPIFSGAMSLDDVSGKKATAHMYTVALRMKSTASGVMILADAQGNPITVSIMGKTLSLNAKLVASQLVSGQNEEALPNGQVTVQEPGSGVQSTESEEEIIP